MKLDPLKSMRHFAQKVIVMEEMSGKNFNQLMNLEETDERLIETLTNTN